MLAHSLTYRRFSINQIVVSSLYAPSTITKIDSLNFLQCLSLHKRLKVHKGCVNTVSWNDKGQYLLSGSDDQTIVVSNPYNGQILVQYNTAHRANIFSAKFMPQSGAYNCTKFFIQYQFENNNKYSI